jgi:hypothetical protein
MQGAMLSTLYYGIYMQGAMLLVLLCHCEGQCDAVQLIDVSPAPSSNAMQCEAVLRSTLRCDAMQCNAMLSHLQSINPLPCGLFWAIAYLSEIISSPSTLFLLISSPPSQLPKTNKIFSPSRPNICS